ncbi:hypothetical protein J6590_042882 [Homalodisca vitripennis]|nr:hypothetical protein J6590_042882 [Homalodisca vitripennis]
MDHHISLSFTLKTDHQDTFPLPLPITAASVDLRVLDQQRAAQVSFNEYGPLGIVITGGDNSWQTVREVHKLAVIGGESVVGRGRGLRLVRRASDPIVTSQALRFDLENRIHTTPIPRTDQFEVTIDSGGHIEWWRDS